MSDANTMLHVYVRTARDVLSRALAKLDTDGLDAAQDDLTAACCVADQIPVLIRDVINSEEVQP